MIRRTMRTDDRGATLLIVLIIITVVALGAGVLLSAADTNVRTTVALRDQAASAYAVDGAAQVAVNQMRNKTFGDKNCAATTTDTEKLSNFFPASGTSPGASVAIDCTADTTTGVVVTGSGVTIDEQNTLGYALLTVGTATGQSMVLSGNNPTCVAGGSVVSNADINLAGLGSSNSLKAGVATSTTDCTLVTDPSVVVTSAGTNGCDGQPTDNNATHFAPTPCTHAGAVPKSTWTTLAPTPNGGYSVTNPAPLCLSSGGVVYAAFRPGNYTSTPTALAAGVSGCSNPAFEWFTPGTYYFQYAGQWAWPTGVVGGTPQDSTGSVITSLVGFDVTDTSAANKAKLAALATVTRFPKACADPALQDTYPGVEFVFGGSATIKPSESGKNEVCATYRDDGIPVALYGVSYDVVGGSSLSLTGGGSIAAETLCTAPPCTDASTGGSPLIASDSAGKNSIFIQGYLYAPSAPVTMIDKNQAAMLLGWGVVVRSFDFTENGASPTTPFVAYRPIKHQGKTTLYTLRYLNVYVCPGSATCDTTGQVKLRAKVKVNADGTVQVLSWSTLR